MSTSHIRSNLPLHNRVCSLPEGGILFPFDTGLHGVNTNGDIIYPEDGYVATLRPGEGRFGGGAVAVEKGTTNLVTNGHFKDGLDGWSQGSMDYIKWENIYNPITNNYGAMYLEDSNSVGYPNYRDIPISNATHSVSAYIEVLEGNFNNITIAGYVKYTDGTNLDMTWNPDLVSKKLYHKNGKNIYRMETTFTPDSTKVINALRIRIAHTDSVATKLIVYAVQVEQKPFATSFVEGSRSGGKLDYNTNLSLLSSGTIRFLVNSSKAMSDHNSYYNGALLSVGHKSGTRQLDLWMQAAGIELNVQGKGKGYVPYEKNTWYDLVLTWKDGKNPKLYINGELRQYGTETFTNVGSGIIRFGTYNNSYINSVLFDEITILPYAATEEQIQVWYHSNAPIYNNADNYITL